MKKCVLGIILMALIMVFTGCEQDSIELERSGQEPVTFHHYFSGTLSGGIDEMVGRYNESQSIYQLNAVPIDHEAYKVSILKSFENGTPADLNSYWAGARTQSVTEYLEPIDEVFEAFELENEFSRALLESASIYDGHYYLIPITQHYVTFYYSLETFEKLNLSEPQTWDEFIKVCESLKSEGITPIGLGAKDKWPAQFWFDYLLLRTAGYQYRTGLMSRENRYDDPEVVYVVEMWKEMLDKGYFNENATDEDWAIDIIPQLMSGEYGMTLMGTWFSGIMAQEGYDGEYGVFSFPIIDANIPYVSLGPVDGIIVGIDALNKDGAKDAIVQFADLNNQIEMAKGSGAFVPNLKTPESVYSEVHLKMLQDMDRSKYWAFNYDLATEPEIASKGLDFFIEFLSFPDAYELLLKELEESMR